ncbi:MAG: hypothetical protein AAGD13_07540 [Pseudomonadota bacterium]
MILKGAQRAGAKQLALHLLSEDDNEFVELHEIRGLLSDDVVGAFKEIEAIAKGTQCKQPFFSVSLSPPPTAGVDVGGFDAAIDRIEAAHGLMGQPRVVIFHEKEGRRHAHAVWSRIDPETMTAKNLPHFKRKLNQIAHELFLEHGWEVPAGFQDGVAASPTNVTLAELSLSRRVGRPLLIGKRRIKDGEQASETGRDRQQASAS